MDSKTVRHKIVFIFCLVVFLAGLLRLAAVSRDQLSAPFDLAFETPNLSTIKTIDAGMNIYDPDVYSTSPFVLTLYTPAYHYLVSWLPEHPRNRFFTGRLVGLFFMAAAASCLLFPCRANRNVGVSLVAMGAFFLVHQVVSHAAYLRNDSMALFFSAAAVIMAEKAGDKAWKIAGTALLTCLAFWSKQSFLAATFTCLFFFFARHRRAGLHFFGAVGGLSALSFLFAQFCWGPGFWFSILVAPLNPFVWRYFTENWIHMFHQPVFVFLAASVFLTAVLLFSHKKNGGVAGSPYFLYLLFSTAMLLATIGKEGANTNYFFEPVLAGLLWLVEVVKRSRLSWAPGLVPLAIMLFSGCVTLELALAKRTAYSFTNEQRCRQMRNYLDDVKSDVNAISPEKPRVLNMAWAGLTFEIQEQPLMNDLFLYSILWNTRVLDASPMLEDIVEQAFDIVILRKDQFEKKDFSTPYDYLIGTVRSAYRLEKIRHYYYLVPKSVSR